MQRTVKTMFLDGGCFCFDFTNTMHSRVDENTYDYINSYDNIMDWSERVKLLPKERLRELRRYADQNKKEAEQKLKDIIDKREVLYTVFSSIICNKISNGSVTEKFNDTLSDSLSKLRLQMIKQKINIGWDENEIDLMEPLWAVYKNAFDIITSAPINRIKECKACGWLFLDKSKNNSRTWCNMQSCGSIEKSKRYYHNVKKWRNK
jgi:predicted RNA-binding Zn ribbon-like protein